jgi:hypothetical protein
MYRCDVISQLLSVLAALCTHGACNLAAFLDLDLLRRQVDLNIMLLQHVVLKHLDQIAHERSAAYVTLVLRRLTRLGVVVVGGKVSLQIVQTGKATITDGTNMVFCVRLLVSGQLGAGFERFATKVAAVVSFCPMNGGHMVVERRVGFESESEKFNRY